MRIDYVPATGCPFGAFIVRAESDEQRALLASFLQPVGETPRAWRFTIHNYGGRCDGRGWAESFMFGWAEVKRRPWWHRFRGTR